MAKLTRTEKFFRTKTEGKVHPKGTIMWTYAVTGTKEEPDAYEETKGENFQTFDDGKFEGQPIYSTSKRLCKAGESVEAKLTDTGHFNVIESIEAAEEQQDTTRLSNQLEKGSKLAEIELKAKMAAKYGVNLA